ncbi:hypothetical protein F2Q70_00014209 [Brassica cretica]|uniref:Uncharacterized protein n=1 Tax=Brassica cretica TaxID=69181 RepID=A0A8S9HVW7_BRACR|nr:hypothetical protein F2Q70_00014209 [Brassica cretica]
MGFQGDRVGDSTDRNLPLKFRSPPDRYVLRRTDSHLDDYLRTGDPTISASGSILLPSTPRLMRDTTVYSDTDGIDDQTGSSNHQSSD